MSSHTLLLTRNPQLANEFSRVLGELTPSAPVIVDTSTQALAQLRSNGQYDVFVDYLDTTLEIEAAQLLEGLPNCPKPHRCFALGKPRFLRSTAALASEVTSGVLMPPLNATSLSASLQSTLGVGALPPLREVTCGPMVLRTRTPQMVAMIDQLLRVAELDVTLLFIGESGTGKTTLAQLVHLMSPRSTERFMAVPCGALPTEIIESELFGHVKGAFTSADRSRDGRFRVVGKGTLLLDEIDTLTARDQAKLLRVIETGEYEPVGSHETLMSEARLIVGANVELSELVQKNEFRADLYYRINVMEFRLPPLRERPWDVIPLALDFVDEFGKQYHRIIERIDTSFLEAVRTYAWPGNIRELKNRVRRAVMFAQSGVITGEDLALPASSAPPAPTGIETPLQVPGMLLGAGTSSQKLFDRVMRSEREILEEALRANGNRRAATARALGISRVGLYKKLRKHGLMGAPATDK